MKRKLIELKGEIDKYTNTVRNFNITFLTTDKTNKHQPGRLQKIWRTLSTIIDIYETFNNRIYILLSAHGLSTRS